MVEVSWLELASAKVADRDPVAAGDSSRAPVGRRAGSPALVPALSTTTLPRRPSAASLARTIPSAIGERQLFP